MIWQQQGNMVYIVGFVFPFSEVKLIKFFDGLCLTFSSGLSPLLLVNANFLHFVKKKKIKMKILAGSLLSNRLYMCFSTNLMSIFMIKQNKKSVLSLKKKVTESLFVRLSPSLSVIHNHTQSSYMNIYRLFLSLSVIHNRTQSSYMNISSDHVFKSLIYHLYVILRYMHLTWYTVH